MFEKLERLPVDPILGLSAACREDPHPAKVDLTVGVYKDEAGLTPVFDAVRLAQLTLTATEQTKVYISQAGDPDFLRGIQELLLGSGNSLLAQGRLSAVQTPGGCGGLRIGAELIHASSPQARVWVSTPTWPNHIPLISSVGLAIEQYRYYDPVTHEVDGAGMLEDLSRASRGDVVLLHGCCHNPCGADLSQAQWPAVADLVLAQGLLPFLAIA